MNTFFKVATNNNANTEDLSVYAADRTEHANSTFYEAAGISGGLMERF